MGFIEKPFEDSSPEKKFPVFAMGKNSEEHSFFYKIR